MEDQVQYCFPPSTGLNFSTETGGLISAYIRSGENDGGWGMVHKRLLYGRDSKISSFISSIYGLNFSTETGGLISATLDQGENGAAFKELHYEVKKMKQIPFWQFCFPDCQFYRKDETPERSYRAILLNLDDREKALKESYFKRKRREIDIEEIKEKLKTATGFEKKRLEVDLEEAEWALEVEIKYIEDCLIEIETYKKLLSFFPEFTREDFEKAEIVYWKKRFMKQAQLEAYATGVISPQLLESLLKIGIEVTQRDGRLVFVENGKPLELEVDLNVKNLTQTG
jgi:hypothetical protein